MTPKFLHLFISKYKYAVLSTVTTDGKPESALVGLAITSELKIIFDTVSTSRKYRNLMTNPGIAFVFGGEEDKTVQYEGRANLLTDTGSDELLTVYYSVFPDGIERKEKWKDLVYFIVEPQWIRYADFTGSQNIEELRF